MQYLPTIFLVFIFFQSLTYTLTTASVQPYCYKNITETSQKVVTKTRLKTVNKEGFFNKLAQKKETQVEEYEDYEPVYKIKVERVCCEGFALTELDLCEPQCLENGCPAHSKCVEPEVCECVAGYFSTRSAKDNKHYCEPICEKACPEHSACVAPNVCACLKGFTITDTQLCEPHCDAGCGFGGKCVEPNKCLCLEDYKAQQGTCLPMCSLGDKCQNGQCVEGDVCLCNKGFEWNEQRLKCENNATVETSTYAIDLTEAQEHLASDLDTETDIDTDRDDVDINQVFEEIFSTTAYSELEHDEDFSTPSTMSEHQKCPDDFVFHKGTCKPLKFVSNEIDCRFHPCQDEHAFCSENGTCVCNEGFQSFKLHIVESDTENQTVKTLCLTKAEYEARLQEQSEEKQEELPETSVNWSTILFMVLGVVVILSALVYLAFRLLSSQTGQLDVEGKNLSCSYSKRAGTEESEKSVI